MGCHSSRRPESLSGRKFVIPFGVSASSLAYSHPLIGQYARGRQFVPQLFHSTLRSGPRTKKLPKAEYIPPAFSVLAGGAVGYPVI